MKSHRNRFYAAALLQLLLLAAMIAYHYEPLLFGTQVRLLSKPVDPRSLFRGDYVRLGYEISVLESSKLRLPGSLSERRGSTLYVGLDVTGPFAKAVSVGEEPPAGLYIRGKLQRSWDGRLFIQYGIETYFVPEGEGLELEHSMAEQRLVVVIAVDSWGRAVIDHLEKVPPSLEAAP